MSAPCYNEIKLGEYLLKEQEEDRLEEAAEKLQEEMFEDIEKTAQTNNDLIDFIESFNDELYDFLIKRARLKIISRLNEIDP